MEHETSSSSSVVAIVAVVAIAIVAYFTVQFLGNSTEPATDDTVIEVQVPGGNDAPVAE